MIIDLTPSHRPTPRGHRASRLAAGAVVPVAVGVGSSALASDASPNPLTFTGCLGRVGVIYHVSTDPAARHRCAGSDTVVSWNQTGPKGDQGAPSVLTFLADATYTVPAGVTIVLLEARAGGGGGTGFTDAGAGGQGAWVQALVPVQPGDVLSVAVGRGGQGGSLLPGSVAVGGAATVSTPAVGVDERDGASASPAHVGPPVSGGPVGFAGSGGPVLQPGVAGDVVLHLGIAG